jgi:hypothetical protein
MLTSKDKKIIDILTKVAIEVIPVSKSKIASALVFGNNITSLLTKLVNIESMFT